MTEKKLNLLHVQKDLTNDLDLVSIAKEFMNRWNALQFLEVFNRQFNNVYNFFCKNSNFMELANQMNKFCYIYWKDQ